MKAVHLVVGILSIVLISGAGLWGAWCWYRVRASPFFWRLLRTGQAVVVVQVALGGVLLLLGYKETNLHLIYGLLPLAVSFIGEQLRIAAAQSVLDKRGFASAQEVGALPAEEQRAVVISIMQRELGVMALAAIVIAVLLLRAAGTAG
jgi:CDP-diglyceride synthetase